MNSLVVDWISWALLLLIPIAGWFANFSPLAAVITVLAIIIPLKLLLPRPQKKAHPDAWAVVTGASTGIGFELARCLLKGGYNLIIISKNPERLNDAAIKLAADKLSDSQVIECLSKDLGQPGVAVEIHEAVRKMITGPVEVLVNNAGLGYSGAFMESSFTQCQEMMQVNINALTELSRLFGADMATRRMGRILNVGSTAGFQPGPYMAIYYATKAYVVSLSEALAFELRNSNVTVTCLCPGPTYSSFAEKAGSESSFLFRMMPVQTSEAVAISGYNGMMAGTRIVIPGTNYSTYLLSRLVPKSLVMIGSAFLNSHH